MMLVIKLISDLAFWHNVCAVVVAIKGNDDDN